MRSRSHGRKLSICHGGGGWGYKCPEGPQDFLREKILPVPWTPHLLLHVPIALTPTGIVASNTRDNNTGATYPHLNFSIPVTVLQPALKQYSQTGDLSALRELDHATEPVRVVWRLQRPLPEAPRSKL